MSNCVDHPSHYTMYPVEVIELTEHMPFLEGNIVKYVARHSFKNGLEDLKKAEWYLHRLISHYENGDKKCMKEVVEEAHALLEAGSIKFT